MTSVIDVDRLMEDLQARVAAARERGAYDPDVLAAPFALAGGQAVRLRIETAYSSKRFVGPVITALKRAAIKLQYHFLNDAVAQTNAALARNRDDAQAGLVELQETHGDRLAALEAEIAPLRAETERMRREILEASDRERHRVDALLTAHRLTAAAPASVTDPGPTPTRADPSWLRLGVDDGGPERLAAYRAAFDPDAPALDLDDAADPLAELEARDEASLGGIIATRLADRLPLDGWLRFAALCASRLRPGGAVAIELVNAATPAGLAHRMRDPSLAPPMHPETAARLLQEAGIGDVEIRAFGEFVDVEAPPLGPELTDAGARQNQLAQYVAERVLGQPFVAIIGRR